MRNNFITKCSFSKFFSLGYIDFLDTRLTPDAFEGPKFPQTIFMSGEGVYYDPFFLDYDNDPLIKSIGISFDQKIWKKFISNLNSKLWTIQPYSYNWFLKERFLQILSFI